MARIVYLMFLALCLLLTGSGSAWAEESLPPKLQRLTDEAYRCYSARETDNFFEAIKQVKSATEFSGYQETYYRACSYEAIYMFEYVDRKQGVTMSHAIYHHAKDNDSNIGMYFATFTLASIREMSGNNDMAEKSFREALELKEKCLPDESAAPCYLGLCEIALRKKDYEQVQVNARKALDEPGIIPMNQITAWSYKCLVRYNLGDSLGFEDAYKERAQLMAEFGGQGGLFGELINVYQAKNRKQWALALKRTDKLIHQQNRCAQKASIYEHMGNLEQALYWQKKTREVMDSIQSSEARAQMAEFDTELSLTYAENDAKEKELANERLMLWAGSAIAVIIIAFLVFIVIRRRMHMKRLQGVHSKLQEAYDQLEATTKAKERIESELRIAREIQKRMLPHVFPRRRDVDLYAMMTPAKEVGGDLYGYALIDDLLYFCVGDVSGKGVPAALFMAEVTRMFRTLVDGKLPPKTIATRLNHALVEDNEQGMFVTMFIGLINLKTGHMEYCNAGHNPPLLDGEYMKMESNAPIGLWSEVEYEGEEVDDMHGKTLFVYTDGINEAENSQHEQFGDERLQALLKQDWGSARQTSESVHKAVEEFVGDAEPSDDLTKMCIIMN
ncbi:MAG: serine/threonine-protein phosphatase [Prevotella sp.]|nr:serine/threonine-protein phosphatase [Prevotella sp.]